MKILKGFDVNLRIKEHVLNCGELEVGVFAWSLGFAREVRGQYAWKLVLGHEG